MTEPNMFWTDYLEDALGQVMAGSGDGGVSAVSDILTKLDAWFAYMAHRYPHARENRCYDCKLPYAVYADLRHGELVSVHKRCPDLTRKGKQPPVGLQYLLDWQRDACKVLETASCECDPYHNFHCLRCRLLEEVHPDQRT